MYHVIRPCYIGYYTIEISPQSCDLTNIVTEFGKFRYNIFQMGLCDYGDIFQAKVNELQGDIKVAKLYIDYVLVLGKGSFSQHIDQLIVIFVRLCVTGLKENHPKCSLG